MTLGEYAKIKGSNLPDIINYARTKGIELPEENNYVLSASELKFIDPKLAYSLRYKRTSSVESRTSTIGTKNRLTTKLESSQLENKESEIFTLGRPNNTPQINIVGKIDLSTINQTARPQTNTKDSSSEQTQTRASNKTKDTPRQLGFVKFFDSFKGFGFIITNKYIPQNNTCVVESIYVNESNISEGQKLVDNQWVSFEKKKSKRGLLADKVAAVTFNDEDLKLALKYIGTKALILGRDKKGDYYNENIFCKIATSYIKKESEIKFLNVISEYFSAIEDIEKRKERIGQLVSNDEVRHLILNLSIENPDDREREMLIIALEIETAENNEAIDWRLIDKWHIVLGLSSSQYDKLAKQIIDNQNFNLLVNLSESFIKEIVNKIDNLDLDVDLLKSIYQSSPSKLHLFLSAKSGRPIERGLSYLIDNTQEIQPDLDAFRAIINEEAFIKPFLSKYYLTNRRGDTLCNGLESDERTRVLMSISRDSLENLPLWMKYEYFILNKDFQLAGELATKNAEDLKNPLGCLFENAEENSSNRLTQFEDFLQPFSADKISKLMADLSLADLDVTFIEATLSKFNYPLFGNIEGLPDNYYFKSYILTGGDSSYISRMSTSDINCWLESVKPNECSAFFNLYINKETSPDILSNINASLIAKCIDGIIEESAQLECINKLPLEVAKNVISIYFNSTQLHSNFMHEQWEKLKLQIPHITFDIESDGERISEFAFRHEENLRSYSSDRQVKSLIRRLKGTPVVVGHNIKEWDLPILEKYGLEGSINGFIWDTLEIELLLNPCRYAYSLRTAHVAREDVELTDDLFWNQLLRLSKNKSLCDELKEELPAEITTYIQLLQDPFFAEVFEAEAQDGNQFFQELIPLDNDLISKLYKLNEQSEQENILVISPKDIWPRIAQYLSLRFPTENSREYYSVVSSCTISDNLLLQKILSRFFNESVTPLVANLPKYLRIGENQALFISNDILESISQPSEGRIDCVDFESFDSIDKLRSHYSRIVTIGGELHDRIHKVQIGDSYDSISPNIVRSKLFLRMAACNYAIVPKEDYPHFGIKKDELTASVWAERDINGCISIFKNLKFKEAKKRFLSNYDAKLEYIEWRLEGVKDKQLSPTIVTIKQNINNNTRLSSSTTFRSKYWAYQFAIIKEFNLQLPIVYVVNDSQEIDKVSALARDLGYYVPSHGSGFRKLEHIESHTNGMVIISKDQFVNGIGEYRTNQPYCYVWDNMDIDRLRLMWDVLPFEDSEVVDGNNETDTTNGKNTSRKCIVAAWPIMNHYHSLIKANSRESQMVIIDPQFDDNTDVADICHCDMIQLESPENGEDFYDLVSISENHFSETEFSMPNLDTEQSMEVIRQSFIPQYEWHSFQKEIMPRVLERKEDLLISLPTGGGKSILFQGPAIFRSATSHRLSIVISPLRALMQDQVEKLIEKGFGSAVDYISGDRTYPEIQEIYRRMRSGEIALVYITPERFRVRSFIKALQQRLIHDKGLEYVVFDEAHCISQWGQEFRPDYRNAIMECAELKKQYDIKLCLLSATITSQIENDIRKFVPDIIRLGQSVEEYNPVRQHIGINFKISQHEDEKRIDEICNYIQSNHIDFSKSRMIIFCRTHRQCEDVAANLAQCTRDLESLGNVADHIGYFHAGMDSDQRNETYKQFKGDVKNVESEIYILCATKAFGMGMDIPNIHYVLHFSPPSVMEDYLQEVGRAGRNEDMYRSAFNNNSQIPAQCLVSTEDFRKLKELLIKSLMSWSDLELVRQRIVDFIMRFKSEEKSSSTRTVVPFNIWTKDDSSEGFNDTTASRIAFHWLEHLNLINLGYLDQACMDLTLHKTWDFKAINGDRNLIVEIEKALNQYCSELGVPSLIPIREMRDRTGRSWPKIVDILLQAQRNSILSINDTIKCIIKPRRLLETEYMIEQKKNIFTLHIIMEGIKSVLSDVGTGKSKTFESDDMRQIVSHLTDEVEFKTKKIKDIDYMPWKSESDTSTSRAIVKRVDTYKKEIITKTGPKIFWLLNYIPGVTSSLRKNEDDETYCIITVQNVSWRDYVEEWERDLFEILKYIKNNNNAFSWASMFLELGLFEPRRKGYTYLDNCLSFLRSIKYIDYTPLISSGIEVQTTEKAFQQIEENPESTSPLYEKRHEFEQEEKLKKIRLSSMDIFSKIDSEKQQEYIKKYFKCRDYDEFLGLVGDYCPDENREILRELSEEALSVEEAKLQDNRSQLEIYNSPITENINVLAGPGSGKTHVLTLRCARLVYREHVDPSRIIVLAYNRAVVVELKNRLNRLFKNLGLSRMAHQMHVYTFHALAKVVMGPKLDNIPTERWENLLYEYMSTHRDQFRARFPGLSHVLIDEFQDITTSRLNTINKIHEYYPDARFFTIGDVNQSIYGFDRVGSFNGTPRQYANLLNPEPYYTRLSEILKPREMSMFTNYRSYQEILDKSAEFLPQGNSLPASAESLMAHAPSSPCVYETDNGSWFSKMPEIIQYAEKENLTGDPFRRIDTIAIFFRTNSEVYRGFTQLKKFNIDSSIRVRIQGSSSCELWRQREMYFIISYLQNNADSKIVLKGDETKRSFKTWIEQAINKCPTWDSFMLDVAYTIVLHYLETIRSDEFTHTFGELADFLKDIAGKDDGGQVYKIYDEYQSERFFKEKHLTIVLTTMHKVKGLEFDVVIVTPSFADLPLGRRRDYKEDEPIQEDDLALIEEERRLRFVAYTRAKKRLYIFNHDREKALMNRKIYITPENILNRLGITERNPGLDKYNLGYHSNSDYTFNFHKALDNIKSNSPVIIQRRSASWGFTYDIIDPSNNYCLGQLSSNSSIRRQMENEDIAVLSGLFVSDIFAWEYQDSVRYDQEHNTGYSARWTPRAKKQGFVYIVQIAGYGQIYN